MDTEAFRDNVRILLEVRFLLFAILHIEDCNVAPRRRVRPWVVVALLWDFKPVAIAVWILARPARVVAVEVLVSSESPFRAL